jgi:BirA family biotin operon repressor/biotin-[acetyl-CoA-carboxylase] ligase
MKLAPPEALLALLVRAARGVPRERIVELLGEAAEPAAAALVHRGHALHHDARGWRLDCAAEHFDPGAFEPSGAFGARLEIWETAASTHDLARAGAVAGGPPGAVWLAESQSAGRGRQGRVWCAAPHSALLVSLAVEATFAPEARPTLLPLALGLGACEALRGATGLDVRTKWPNDLVLAGRKLGGLLVDALPAGGAVVGFGLNVRAGATAGFDLPGAIALGDVMPSPPREILLAAVLAGLEKRHSDWRAARWQPLLDAYSKHESTFGRVVRADSGGVVVEGPVRGVTETGQLRIETSAGVERRLVAAEVHLL